MTKYECTETWRDGEPVMEGDLGENPDTGTRYLVEINHLGMTFAKQDAPIEADYQADIFLRTGEMKLIRRKAREAATNGEPNYEQMSPLSSTPDDDLFKVAHWRLIDEIRLFRRALAYCKSQDGDDNCWMYYRHLLMRFLPGYDPARDDVRLDADQLTNCKAFIAAWQKGEPWDCKGGDAGKTVDARSIGTLACLTPESAGRWSGGEEVREDDIAEHPDGSRYKVTLHTNNQVVMWNESGPSVPKIGLENFRLVERKAEGYGNPPLRSMVDLSKVAATPDISVFHTGIPDAYYGVWAGGDGVMDGDLCERVEDGKRFRVKIHLGTPHLLDDDGKPPESFGVPPGTFKLVERANGRKPV